MPIAREWAFDYVSSNAWHGKRTGSHGRKQIGIAWLESRRPPENEGGATGYPHPAERWVFVFKWGQTRDKAGRA